MIDFTYGPDRETRPFTDNENPSQHVRMLIAVQWLNMYVTAFFEYMHGKHHYNRGVPSMWIFLFWTSMQGVNGLFKVDYSGLPSLSSSSKHRMCPGSLAKRGCQSGRVHVGQVCVAESALE